MKAMNPVATSTYSSLQLKLSSKRNNKKKLKTAICGSLPYCYNSIDQRKSHKEILLKIGQLSQPPPFYLFNCFIMWTIWGFVSLWWRIAARTNTAAKAARLWKETVLASTISAEFTDAYNKKESDSSKDKSKHLILTLLFMESLYYN